jgi:hypothetical protein
MITALRTVSPSRSLRSMETSFTGAAERSRRTQSSPKYRASESLYHSDPRSRDVCERPAVFLMIGTHEIAAPKEATMRAISPKPWLPSVASFLSHLLKTNKPIQNRSFFFPRWNFEE